MSNRTINNLLPNPASSGTLATTRTDYGTLNSGKTAISTLKYAHDWTLDELGNWATYKADNDGNGNYNSTGDLNQSRAHTAANETGTLTATYGASWVSPTYDLAGNMGSETTNLKFIYDAWNRMVQVTDNSSTIIATYRFDGQNHRIQKLLGSNPSSPTSYYDYYYNENWQVMEERLNGSGTTLNAQYVWDPRYIDAPVVRFGALGTIYYCEDANMNVTSVTATSGLAVERYSYDAYGQVHIYGGSYYESPLGSSAYGNEILFGGYRYDPETGLYHVRNRTYHPTLGRWGQTEPFGADYIDGPNLYIGYGDNSILNIDPFGLNPSIVSPQGVEAMAIAGEILGGEGGGGAAIGGGTALTTGTGAATTAVVATPVVTSAVGTTATVGTATVTGTATGGTAAAAATGGGTAVAAKVVTVVLVGGAAVGPIAATGLTGGPPPAPPSGPDKKEECPDNPCKSPINIITVGKDFTPADMASLIEYVCKVNKWFMKPGAGPQTLKPLSKAEINAKRTAAQREFTKNSSKYPEGILVVGHVPDTGLTHMPDPLNPPAGLPAGEWLPMTAKANFVAGGAIGDAVKKGKTVDCLQIDGKKPDCP